MKGIQGKENESGATIKPNGLELLQSPHPPPPRACQLHTSVHTDARTHILSQPASGSYGACTILGRQAEGDQSCSRACVSQRRVSDMLVAVRTMVMKVQR